MLGFAAGCRHGANSSGDRNGSSSFSYVTPPPSPPVVGSQTAELQQNLHYREAEPIGTLTLPIYPRAALAAKFGAATVGVRVTVDTRGQVSDMRPSVLVFSTPGPHAEMFRVAVEAALRTWRFVPAAELKTEIVQEGGQTIERVVHGESVEAEFDLAFSFTAKGKVEAVSSDQAR